MFDNPVIFYPAAFLITGFALISLFAKNVIYSLLAAIMVFFTAALIFYVLGSEYNAIIQAAIYGFAVPVIVGLSIMFSGDKQAKSDKSAKFAVPYAALMCAGIFILAFVYLVMISLVITPDTFNINPAVEMNTFDTISAFARGIFVNYVWAFELVSLLLTIVIAGLSMFYNKNKGGVGKNV